MMEYRFNETCNSLYAYSDTGTLLYVLRDATLDSMGNLLFKETTAYSNKIDIATLINNNKIEIIEAITHRELDNE